MKKGALFIFIIVGILAFGQVPPAQNQELSYDKWLKEDVAYIITPEERADFLKLSGDDERDMFVVEFWLHRDPTPGTPENEYKEEHYRRIAYSNEHFAEKVPGWKTDRGRAYITFGPPDEVLRSPNKVTQLQTKSETWVYQNVHAKGQEQRMTFVDKCRCGEYRLQAPGRQASQCFRTACGEICGSRTTGSTLRVPSGANVCRPLSRS